MYCIHTQATISSRDHKQPSTTQLLAFIHNRRHTYNKLHTWSKQLDLHKSFVSKYTPALYTPTWSSWFLPKSFHIVIKLQTYQLSTLYFHQVSLSGSFDYYWLDFHKSFRLIVCVSVLKNRFKRHRFLSDPSASPQSFQRTTRHETL